jgi:hypothetical protein
MLQHEEEQRRNTPQGEQPPLNHGAFSIPPDLPEQQRHEAGQVDAVRAQQGHGDVLKVAVAAGRP